MVKGERKKEEVKKESKEEKEIRGIVRLCGRDLEGGLPLKRAITKIKGVGIRLANIIGDIAFSELKLPRTTLMGELSDEQIEKVEEIIFNPSKYGVPSYLLNRQKDIETGENRHMMGNELIFAVRKDIEREKEMKSWRGFRHIYAKKVRGQRTRSTGRKGMTVGVLRKAALQKGAQAPKKKEEEKKK